MHADSGDIWAVNVNWCPRVGVEVRVDKDERASLVKLVGVSFWVNRVPELVGAGRAMEVNIWFLYNSHIVQPLLPDLDGRADDALDPFQTDKPLRPTAGYNPVTTE
jgi:hypothetical protein